MLLSTLAGVILWPVLAAQRLQQLASAVVDEPDEAEKIFTAIDRVLSDNDVPRSAPLRKAVERYIFLTAAWQGANSNRSKAGELAEIAGHPNPDLAAVCLARKERGKLKHHKIAAADDLLLELDQIPASLLSEITEAIERACESLGDSNTAIRVSELSFERTINHAFVPEAGIKKAA